MVERGGEANSLKQQQNGQLELATESIKLNECNFQIMMEIIAKQSLSSWEGSRGGRWERGSGARSAV